MTTPVYATRITSLSDARYFSGMGVQWLGIQTDPAAAGYMTAEQFRQIAGWVNGPQFILEVFTLGDRFDPIVLSLEYGVDQFCISPSQISKVASGKFGLHLDHPEDVKHVTDMLFVILPSPAELDSTNMPSVTRLIPGPSTVQEAVEILGQHPDVGFVVKGSPEEAVGIKEYESMDLLEFLDEED